MTNKSDWYKAYFCVKCKARLSYHEVMYSRGTCPHCGNHEGITIIETYQESCRFVKTAPWWKRWGDQGYEEFQEKS